MNGQLPFDPENEAHLLSAFVDGELDAAGRARVEAHLAASAEALRSLLRASRAASISPLSWFTRAPNSRRWSGAKLPRVFIRPVTLPFLPRAATRAASPSPLPKPTSPR